MTDEIFKYFDKEHEIRGVTLDSSKTFNNEWHDVKVKNDLFDKCLKSFLFERVADSSKWQIFIFTFIMFLCWHATIE